VALHRTPLLGAAPGAALTVSEMLTLGATVPSQVTGSHKVVSSAPKVVKVAKVDRRGAFVAAAAGAVQTRRLYHGISTSAARSVFYVDLGNCLFARILRSWTVLSLVDCDDAVFASL
jgi:hypothetical protein